MAPRTLLVQSVGKLLTRHTSKYMLHAAMSSLLALSKLAVPTDLTLLMNSPSPTDWELYTTMNQIL